MSLAVESGMALKCCAFSVSSLTGVRGSVAVVRQLTAVAETEGAGAGAVAACIVSSSSIMLAVLSFQRVDLKSELSF